MPRGMSILFYVCLGLIIVSLIVGFFGKHTDKNMFSDGEYGKGGGQPKKKGLLGGLFGKKGGGGHSGGPSAGGPGPV